MKSTILSQIDRNRRRGVASVLAMLYLVLFAVLALGFYAATSTAVQVVGNEQKIAAAQMSAESGVKFLQYQLAQVAIPHGTSQSQLFTVIYNGLSSSLNGTTNMGGRTVGLSGSVISIPSDSGNYISLDSASGAKFQASITNLGQKIRVRVVGRGADSNIYRAVQLDYDMATKASSIFNFGVASKGKITTGGSARIEGATDPAKGSVLSTCMTDPTPVAIGGRLVSGDISVVNSSANVTYAGASVGGTTDATLIARDHIHKGVEEPEFPTIDTDAFLPYVTSNYTSGKNLTNVRIRANTNPRFSGGATIRGVVYVETPNVVTFRGNVDIQGVIVVQNSPTGNLTNNVLDFSGSVSAKPVSTLPASYGGLRQLTGAFVLAPNFTVNFSGDFGTVGGSIIGGNVNFSGNATGTVQGSVINLNNTPMSINGSSDVIIASTGTTDYPAGVFFSSVYVPLPDTYEEVP